MKNLEKDSDLTWAADCQCEEEDCKVICETACLNSCECSSQGCQSCQCSTQGCQTSQTTCQNTCECSNQSDMCGHCMRYCECNIEGFQCDTCQNSCECYSESTQCGSRQNGCYTCENCENYCEKNCECTSQNNQTPTGSLSIYTHGRTASSLTIYGQWTGMTNPASAVIEFDGVQGVNWDKNQRANPGYLQQEFTGLTPNSYHTAKIIVVDDFGKSEDTWSGYTDPILTPEVPTNIKATVNGNSVTISFTKGKNADKTNLSIEKMISNSNIDHKFCKVLNEAIIISDPCKKLNEMAIISDPCVTLREEEHIDNFALTEKMAIISDPCKKLNEMAIISDPCVTLKEEETIYGSNIKKDTLGSSFTITNLDYSQKYSFMLQSQSNYGQVSNWTSQQTFTTGPLAPATSIPSVAIANKILTPQNLKNPVEVYFVNKGGISEYCRKFALSEGSNAKYLTHEDFRGCIPIEKRPALIDANLVQYKGVTAWQSSAQIDGDGSSDGGEGTHLSELALAGPTINGITQYFDASKIPFIVQPMYNKNAVGLGDLGVVINTKNKNYVYVVYADRGPAGVIGEASIRTHNDLGIFKALNIGHDENDLVYIMFEGSKTAFNYSKKLPTRDEIQAKGKEIFEKFVKENNL